MIAGGGGEKTDSCPDRAFHLLTRKREHSKKKKRIGKKHKKGKVL